MQRGTALGGARIAIPCCKGTQAGMIPPCPQIDQTAILPLARRAQPTAATAALEAQIAPGIVDSREGQRPVAVGQLLEAALRVEQCVAEGIGRARDAALGMQSLGAVGIQLLIAIAADRGEDTRQGDLLIQDEVGGQAVAGLADQGAPTVIGVGLGWLTLVFLYGLVLLHHTRIPINTGPISLHGAPGTERICLTTLEECL